jgi:Lon protease-like protein
MSHDSASLGDFRGTVRLFPLPNLVLFPHVLQPLHIFEPRYRQLMADALEDDRLITLALLEPGWEEDYHKRPPVYPVVCIGRIFQEERLADGRYNLLLHGVSRARIRKELPSDKLYRTARVDLLADVSLTCTTTEAELRRRLGSGMTAWFSAQSGALAQLRKLLASNLELGTLCDIFSFALPLGPDLKMQLLAEVDVEARARMLLEQLAAKGESSSRRFPPEFSQN